MKSKLMAVMSALLLSGCATARPPMLAIGVCPDLPAPPDRVLDALDVAARGDEASGDWVIDLSQHYDALDRCAAP